jgi:hypothetical protein
MIILLKKIAEFEDLYWVSKAQQAGEGAFLSKEETNDFLNSIINSG